ncbi:protein FAR1-RELATED SEQUENCE 5-like [Henckelia pumila]|uniref:protein FAR1-RELATED SEQUENCE 5-like n=1 Tax=Henckelia pumila TaxID=405737 RepID=UPI003C6E08D1
MQSDDPNFFYAIQVDNSDLITNIFWADGQMIADYVYFRDVVCFDTTFRKNKEGRPFALFVGVNHHKQTVIFGAALLYDETAQTFMWLFDTFAKTMHGKTPGTILTDQDAAMAKALAEKWPETSHRLCIWHIYQNAAIHLSNAFSSFNMFAKDFSSCVYDLEEEEEFLVAWEELFNKYNLQSNQ